MQPTQAKSPKKGTKGSGKPQVRRRLSVMPGSISVESEAKLDGIAIGEDEAKATEMATGAFAKGGVVKEFTSLSRVGYVPFNNRKVNQDRYTEHPMFAGEKTKSLFGVFDGHGVHGHDVSQFLITHLPTLIAKGKNLEKHPHAQITRSFLAANAKLDKSGIDTTCSGTTAVVCYINGTRIYTCNSGDSRAIVATLQDGKIIAKGLSIDQKPELESERKRILENNGRVQACQDLDGNPVGPMRVWLKHQDIPGLAMTRSFGDKLAASVGVTCKPEILEYDLKEGVDQFLVLGSDGIWEFISNQEAADIVAAESTAKAAAKALVEEATARWKKEEEVIDDITATIVYLKGSKYPAMSK